MMMMAVAAVDAELRVDNPTEGEDDDDEEEDPYDTLDYLGHLPPIQPPLEDLGLLGVHHLVPWVKQIYNDVYG